MRGFVGSERMLNSDILVVIWLLFLLMKRLRMFEMIMMFVLMRSRICCLLDVLFMMLC